MNKVIELLSQRRIWSGIVGVTAFILMVFHINYQIDVPLLTDILTSVGGGLAMLIPALLSLWSYFFPKK